MNALKRALAAGQVQIGIHARIPSSYAIEVIAGAGFDVVMIDAEHTPLGPETVLAQLQALAGYPVSAAVQLPCNDMTICKQFLDAGLQTIAVPHVSSAQEAESAVSYARFAPRGRRGFAHVTRASRFGRVGQYYAQAADETCVIAMVETREGVQNLRAICAVDGIDAVLIGPGDLRASMGWAPGEGGEQMRQLMENAIREIRACGRAAGVIEPVEADARRWIECGAQLMIVGSDLRLLGQSADALRARYDVVR
ncbi:MAG: HpcH/HpaI aldolase/citrate lyase family protein [Lautropia sp.]